MVELPELLLLFFSCFCIAMFQLFNYNPAPIFNIYRQPDGYYWFKVILMYIVLYFRQLLHKIKLALKDEKSLKKYYAELEKPQKLSNHDHPIDAVFFNAANKNGQHLLVALARRKNKLIDGFLFAQFNNEKYGLLESPKLPSTSIYQDEEREGFEAEGFKVECLEPMKKWSVKYEGKLKKHSNPNEHFNVILDAVYTSDQPFFNLDDDMDPFATAKFVALEKWSKEYFQARQFHHQTHYEQHGNIKGNMVVDGESIPIDMDCMRDHSFGNHREWSSLHKYNFQMFAAENGDRFTVGDICFPQSMSVFQMGFVYSAADKKVYPITSNDFILYQHGESGTPPVDYAFTITAGGKTYVIKVDVKESPYIYISKDWESKVFERLCRFRINGMEGWGCSEWQQRNLDGKNVPDYHKLHKSSNCSNLQPVKRLLGLKATEKFEEMLKPQEKNRTSQNQK